MVCYSEDWPLVVGFHRAEKHLANTDIAQIYWRTAERPSFQCCYLSRRDGLA
jgi:hypothetical protein